MSKSMWTGKGVRFDSEGVEIKTLRCREGYGVGRGCPLPTGDGVWEGGCALPDNFLIFHLKWRAVVHPERHFCQEMFAGYSDYNTMFAGQADMLKRK